MESLKDFNFEHYLKVCSEREKRGLPVDEVCKKYAIDYINNHSEKDCILFKIKVYIKNKKNES